MYREASDYYSNMDIQLNEKYKEHFDVSSEGPPHCTLYSYNLGITGSECFHPIFNSHIFMINSMLNHVALLKVYMK
jgi:hypothetical protein